MQPMPQDERPQRSSAPLSALALLLCYAVLVAAPAPLPGQSSSHEACLHYEPDTAAVTGRLARHTFYGPPGYGESPSMDARETGFYLELPAPVCASGGREEKETGARRGVRRIQLVLDSAGYARLRPSVGQRVTLRGTLFADVTAHHHAPLLLQVLPPAPPP